MTYVENIMRQTTKMNMDTNSGSNCEQIRDSSRAEIDVHMETVGYHRDLPPPYTVQDVQPHTVIRETIIIQPPLKDAPMFFPCSKCYKRVLTKVKYVNTRKTHMMAGFIFGFTCWCCLCCFAGIPYLIPTFKRVKHYCPECHTYLGDYSKV
ncbi:lipopolysaccharide-induced tumor necrosis factor-alpha factor homolog [Cydia fagiglandana]|uniref:lipopolysaccharide-induced tumor necrosis factor-alpha factor homolog n=1 Tax=Cydia fagiglandana TaxID=1458189 RepID=UPI002FEE5EBB